MDARNVFTQVDRAHRKFSEEQIKNLAIITRLYEGDTAAFDALICEYIDASTELIRDYHTKQEAFSKLIYDLHIASSKEMARQWKDDCYLSFSAFEEFTGIKEYFEYDISSVNSLDRALNIKTILEKHTQELWEQMHDVERGIHHNLEKSPFDKEVSTVFDAHTELIKLKNSIIYSLDNLIWLWERFPDGVYRDVVGLCKVAKLDGEDGIKDQDYSLNPGRYVGVVIEDDGMTADEFKAEMLSLNEELATLNSEAYELEKRIAENLKGLFN